MALVDALRTFMYVSLWGKPVISVGRGLSGLIKSIFRSGEQGFAYDINDLSTLYQDAAGTIPVTGAGQPVGLVLDKRKGLVLGDVEYAITASVIGVPIGGDGLTTYLIANNLTAGKWYKISFTVTNYTGTANVGLTSGPNNAFGSGSNLDVTAGASSNTTITYIGLAIRSEQTLFTRSTNTANFTNISIRELPGNHAYQTTSSMRPLLQRNATTGAYYLAFDGTDDFLVTNSIDFTATDKVSLFAGVRKLSDAAVGMVCELSASFGTNNGTFGIATPDSTVDKDLTSNSRGTVHSRLAYYGLTSPRSIVVSAKLQISTDTNISRVNGVKIQTSLDQGTGNYGNYPLYIGRRGGITFPFNGHIYSLIGVARLSTDAETTNLEKAIAKNVGVTI